MPKIDSNLNQELDLSAREGGHERVTSEVERQAPPSENPTATDETLDAIKAHVARPLPLHAKLRQYNVSRGRSPEGRELPAPPPKPIVIK